MDRNRTEASWHPETLRRFQHLPRVDRAVLRLAWAVSHCNPPTRMPAYGRLWALFEAKLGELLTVDTAEYLAAHRFLLGLYQARAEAASGAHR